MWPGALPNFHQQLLQRFKFSFRNIVEATNLGGTWHVITVVLPKPKQKTGRFSVKTL